MVWIYLVLLFVITFICAALPLMWSRFQSSWIPLLLAFSGSFLLGITCLHLLPETFHELDEKAGIFIIAGFFFQLLLQRFSHGIEHGHLHHHGSEMQNHISISVLFGLGIHAFMEGIPLGFNYQTVSTSPSIFLGVAAHKIPEAMTLSFLLLSATNTTNKWIYVLIFSLLTPLSGVLATVYGQKFYYISNLLTYIIPFVIGSFLHISTTILYESGTKHHELSKQKIIALTIGLLFSFITLLFHVH